MGREIELLSEVNSYLKPLGDIVIFLFASWAGIGIILLLLISFMALSIWNSIHVRRLAYEALDSDTAKINFGEKIYLVLSAIGKAIAKLSTNIPILIGIFFILFFIVFMASGLQAITRFVENQKRIQELNLVLKHLNKKYRVAEMEVIDQINDETTIKMRYFDYADFGFDEDSQTISIKGTDIFIDAIVINFKYSEIESNTVTNLALPYKIFSDEVPQAEGFDIELEDESGMPFIFRRSTEDIYGISMKDFKARSEEIVKLFYDKEAARKAGVRSFYGSAVHKRVRAGDLLSIWIEQTGGIVIRKEEHW